MSGYPNYSAPPYGAPGPGPYRPPGGGGNPRGGGNNGCTLAAIIVMVVVGIPTLLLCAGLGVFFYFVKSTVDEVQAKQQERQAQVQQQIAAQMAANEPPKPVTNVDEAIEALQADHGQRPQMGAEWLIKSPVDASKRAVVVTALVGLLDSQNGQLANVCLKALGIWGSKENAAAVAKTLKKFGADQRQACEILGKWKDPAVAGAVAEVLNEAGQNGEAAEKALVQIGPEAKAAVLAQLSLERRTAHTRAERLLAAYGVDVPDAVITARLNVIKSGNRSYRREAVKSLASLPFKPERQTDVARALDAVVAENDNSTRDDALNGLLVWGDKESAKGVARLVKSETFVNKTAVRVLEKLQDPSAVDALASLLNNAFIADRELQSALVAYGADAEKAVLPSMHDSRHKARDRARAVLTELGAKPDALLTQTILDLSSSDDQRVRNALEWLATAKIDESRQGEVAAKLAGPAKNFFTQKQALEVLVKCNSPAAAATLAELIRDRGTQNRVSDAFHKAGPASEDVLLVLLENADPNVVGYACTGLANYGSEKSIKPLQAVLRKAGSANKQLAAVARTAVEAVQKRTGG